MLCDTSPVDSLPSLNLASLLVGATESSNHDGLVAMTMGSGFTPPYQDAPDGVRATVPEAASGARPPYLLCPALGDSSPPQPCPTHVQSSLLMELGDEREQSTPHVAAMFLSAGTTAQLL